MALFMDFLAGAGLAATASKYVAQYRDTDLEKAGRILTLSGLVALGTGTLGARTIAASLWAAHGLLPPRWARPELTNSSDARQRHDRTFFVALNWSAGGALSGLEAFGTNAVASTVGAVLTTICTVIGGIVAGVIGCVWGTAIGQAITWVVFHVMLRARLAAKHTPKSPLTPKGGSGKSACCIILACPFFSCDVIAHCCQRHGSATPSWSSLTTVSLKWVCITLGISGAWPCCFCPRLWLLR